MTLNDTYQEIVSITQKLIELGMSIQQNFPHRAGNNITCKEGVDVSAVLRNITYKEKYEILNNDNNYNIKLLDGAIIQMMYSFNNTGRNLLSHRLAFFPAPHLENYEDAPNEYQNSYFGDSEYHDLLESNIIKIPFRFDFCNTPNTFEDIHHPYAHLHLGEYENCRIPSYSPITPSLFMNFILRNFYNSALINYCDNYSFQVNDVFDPTITENERKLIHISLSR